ncbi:MAG: tetratricopeptide repeat protein [Terriglobales bacterium]
MTKSVRVLVLLSVAVLLFSATGCNKLRARDQLNKGVQSYKNARYEEAIEHFKNAVSFDPGLVNARLYLATAYAQQYIPNADNPENVRNAEQAIEQYKKVLEKDPNNINSVKGIAFLYLQMKKLDQAKEYYERATKIDPNDPEPYYSVAVIDWTQSYRPRMEQKARLGLGAAEPIKDKKACDQLRIANLDKVEDGMRKLQKALQLRPDYEDAMAYMNLLYREKADMECSDATARTADLKAADDWVDKTMAARKAKEQKQQASGIVLAPKNE